VWLFWRGIERHLRRAFALDAHGLVPGEPIERLVGCGLSLASGGFYERVADGTVRVRRGEVAGLAPGGVRLGDGTPLYADVVVFGTGFRQEAPFLSRGVLARVRGDDGSFRLHRNIIPPEVPRLAFVGYNASLYSQLTSEIAARWLVEHVQGRIALPPVDEMQRGIDDRLAWLRAERPNHLASGTCIVPFNFHYLNDLLRDMGARTWRTRNRLREYMMPVDPSVYANLGAELAEKRARRATPREPSFTRIAG
jgi:hypothetical protein